MSPQAPGSGSVPSVPIDGLDGDAEAEISEPEQSWVRKNWMIVLPAAVLVRLSLSPSPLIFSQTRVFQGNQRLANQQYYVLFY